MVTEELKEQGRLLNEAIKSTPEFALASKELARRLADTASRAKLNLSQDELEQVLRLSKKSPMVASAVVSNAEDELILNALLLAATGFMINGGVGVKCSREVAAQRVSSAQLLIAEYMQELLEYGYPVEVGPVTTHPTTTVQ